MSDKETKPAAGTKPYRKPVLRVYGDIGALTENKFSSMGALDGGFYGQPLKTGG